MSTIVRRGAQAASVLAALTVLARLAGFARTAAFGRSVGSGCVGSVYQTANYIPNIVFEVVAGGMLSALVVPVLAPALAAGDQARADAIVSALLTWTVVILVPVAALMALAAGPIVSALLGSQSDCPGAHSLGVRMLLVFAPQIVFYGLGVILGGALTAGHRFSWPAVAPLLSSLVVIAAYLTYGALAGPGRAVEGLSSTAELVLSVGTTLGVVVLAGCLVVPAWRSGLRWRPALRFPPGVARVAALTAAAGAATLAAQQVATAVMIRLANNATAPGTLVIVTMAQTVFLLPWAVLSVPVATTAFPRLAALWDAREFNAFRQHAATASAVVIALAALGTALLVAVAEPAGIVLLRPGAASLSSFAPTVAGFAGGLLGWSLVALLARTLYAAGHVRVAAIAQVMGQVVVVLVDVVLTVSLPVSDRAWVLGVGNSVGVTVAAVLLVVAGRRCGALGREPGQARAVVVAVFAAGAAGGCGWLIGSTAHGRSTAPSLGLAVAAAVATALVFAVIMFVGDRALVETIRARGPVRLRRRVEAAR